MTEPAVAEGGRRSPLARDRFDYDALRALFGRVSESHALVRLTDFADGAGGGARVCLLRHDVDYSVAAALRLARWEAEHRIRASYFFLFGGSYYDLLAPEHASAARTVTALGHEVGLHYDARFFSAFEPDARERVLRRQLDLLSELSGSRVRAIAMHQPGLVGEDPFRDLPDLVNAYGERCFAPDRYASDSCRAWRDSGWELLERDPLPDRFQLLLHAENWARRSRPRGTIFRAVHRGLRLAVARAERRLREAVARHRSTLEHERAVAGGDPDR